MYRSRSARCIVLTIALLAATTLTARGDEIGVSEDAILFGQAAALEGPSSALGQRMRQGIVAAFTEINAKGGVHGRKLQLISRDDGYDPDRSVAQTLRLIEDDKVFALIGAVGTPTAMATIPITSAQQRALHRSVQRRRILARCRALERRQHSRQLRRRGRGVDQAPHRRSPFHPHRHLLPGRFLRPRRSCGREARACQARPRACRRRHLRAQHQGGRRGLADDQARRARGDRHGRDLRSLRRIHQARTPQRRLIRPSSTSRSSAPMRSPESSAPRATASSSRRSCRFRGTAR